MFGRATIRLGIGPHSSSVSYQVFFVGVLFTASYHRPLWNPMRPRLLRAICCTVHILAGFENRGAALLSCSCLSVRSLADRTVMVGWTLRLGLKEG